MRMSQAEKDRSRERIVASAARLMRERGLDGASVGEVMKAAGMTHGGFYKHFDSKDALLEAGLDRAFDDVVGLFSDPSPGGEAAAAARFRAFYLSEQHLASPGQGCPVAGLSGEVARGGGDLKAGFGAGVRKMAALIAGGIPGAERARRRRAMRQLAMMAGAILIARASDEATAQEILACCREGLE